MIEDIFIPLFKYGFHKEFLYSLGKWKNLYAHFRTFYQFLLTYRALDETLEKMKLIFCHSFSVTNQHVIQHTLMNVSRKLPDASTFLCFPELPS